VEKLQAGDPWEYQEILRLVEQGVLPSVQSYVDDMNQLIQTSFIPTEAPQRKAAPQARRAAQRSKE
jgi:hypothetical protein